MALYKFRIVIIIIKWNLGFRSHTCSLDSFVGLEQTKPTSDPLAFLLNLFLHQIETHGQQRQTERQPQSTENQLLV